MKRLICTIAVILLLLPAFAQQVKRHIDYVDPFIGTGGHGHTFPGAVLPFGMVQLSPDNGSQGWDWCSGYHYSDSIIAGFSHTHLSGTGIGDLCDISVMPSTGRAADTLPTPSRFNHNQESASPGYYQVFLKDFEIKAELTATERCGFHRYTFPASGQSMIRLDLGFAINWDSPVEGFFHKVNDSTYAGYRRSKGWANDQWVYFAIRLSKPVTSINLFADQQAVNGNAGKGKKLAACFNFKTRDKEVVLMKVGLSSASESGAVKSLDEIKGWDFDQVKGKAETAWESALSVIDIKAGTETEKRIFYTALYHTCMAPVLYNDADGAYKSATGTIAGSTRPVYTVHSLWDTFRGENPLLTITQPGRVADIINSYLAFYRQTGLLPVWDLYFNETDCMTGYHCVPVLADAIQKNIGGFDYEEAYKAMKASSMQNKRGTEFYRQYGYLPQDKAGYSVTITLEYAYDDWCIAQVAKKLGHADEYSYYSQRASGYKNLFDSSTGFFRGKNSDGKFAEPFDPYYSDHTDKAQYVEGTAWQHTFFVPHAVNEYAMLLGGKEKLVEKLDSLFSTTSQMHGENVSNDISGLIGQYAHGNEPSHHIAYMYTALGEPQKSANRLRQIMTTLYRAEPDGLSGNEDCGQMSAWYVWSALGIYPMNAASAEYVLGYPMVDEAEVTVGADKKLVIKVTGERSANAFIKKATLNGKEIITGFIRHQDLMQGGVLEFTLGSGK